jgi:ribosomal protein L16 Arg81 hydroxylase
VLYCAASQSGPRARPDTSPTQARYRRPRAIATDRQFISPYTKGGTIMAQQAGIVQESVDRVREAFGSIEDEAQRVQKRVQKELKTRRRDLEKQLNSNRKDFEKRTRKVRTEIRKNATFKRLESLRKDVTKQLEGGVENVLGSFSIASKTDVQRIDRKLSQLNKKLKEMERTRTAKPKATPVEAARPAAETAA